MLQLAKIKTVYLYQVCLEQNIVSGFLAEGPNLAVVAPRQLCLKGHKKIKVDKLSHKRVSIAAASQETGCTMALKVS